MLHVLIQIYVDFSVLNCRKYCFINHITRLGVTQGHTCNPFDAKSLIIVVMRFEMLQRLEYHKEMVVLIFFLSFYADVSSGESAITSVTWCSGTDNTDTSFYGHSAAPTGFNSPPLVMGTSP